MKKLENRRQISALVWLFTFTYMISYVTRTNFGAIILEMQTDTGMDNSLLSLALTGSFAAYGTGQILSGYLGDRISPKKLVFGGLFLTMIMNVCIPVCRDVYQIILVWSINGFAQSLLWPPLVKIMAEMLSEEDYKRAVTRVCWGGSLGTVLVYLSAPIIIRRAGWEWVFLLSAVSGAIMLLLWNRYGYETADITSQRSEEVTGKSWCSPVMLGVMGAIILQGMLRDGVTTWTPSYISEIYGLNSEISILSGALLPVFSIFCLEAARQLHTKKWKNPLQCAGVFFAVGTVTVLALFCSSGYSVMSSVLLLALFTGCMQGVNLMLISMLPRYFVKYGKASTVSGMLNACTYIGSAFSMYGFARFSEYAGWKKLVVLWICLSAAGVVLCLLCKKSTGSLWNANEGEEQIP